jgi:K+-sensing histidine kinase KdpD
MRHVWDNGVSLGLALCRSIIAAHGETKILDYQANAVAARENVAHIKVLRLAKQAQAARAVCDRKRRT